MKTLSNFQFKKQRTIRLNEESDFADYYEPVPETVGTLTISAAMPTSEGDEDYLRFQIIQNIRRDVGLTGTTYKELSSLFKAIPGKEGKDSLREIIDKLYPNWE